MFGAALACAKSAHVSQNLSYLFCEICLSVSSLITLPQTVTLTYVHCILRLPNGATACFLFFDAKAWPQSQTYLLPTVLHCVHTFLRRMDILNSIITAQGGGGGGGHSHMPCNHNCDRDQNLDCQFFTVFGSWLLTVTFDSFGVSCALQTPSGTCTSRRELVLLNAGLYCRNKRVIVGLLLVSCTYDLFSSTVKSSLVLRPLSYSFNSQPTGTATMQHWLRWCVTLETRLIFTVKVTVLGYFDRWPVAKNPFWLLTALWPRSQLWLQGIWEWPPPPLPCGFWLTWIG